MNDLFSSSFKKYSDLKEQPRLDDVEAGRESVNLDKFFGDVEDVKEDMRMVEKLYRKLQEANEESKVVHNAKTVKDLRARMDKDVEQALKHVKFIKGKLEALERSNAANRKLPGCGPGSSADRTRSSVLSGLGKKLKDMMDDFQGLRARMQHDLVSSLDIISTSLDKQVAIQREQWKMVESDDFLHARTSRMQKHSECFVLKFFKEATFLKPRCHRTKLF